MSTTATALPPGLYDFKLRLIDRAFERLNVTRFADLGGVWAVDGGYARYALQRSGVVAGTLVDDLIDDLSPEAKDSGLELIRSNLAEAAPSVPEVDALLMFDILLHQVAPDWDEFIELYAPRTRALIVVNPQYRGDETFRLLDLERESYLDLVPQNEQHDRLYDRLDEPHRGRTWRDAHDVWQWAITDSALVDAARSAGFRLIYLENEGSWRGNEHFDNTAFVFEKR
jgi:hypothetical protein